jgi:hypothetical protein
MYQMRRYRFIVSEAGIRGRWSGLWREEIAVRSLAMEGNPAT